MTDLALKEMEEKAKKSQNELDYSLGYMDGYAKAILEIKKQISESI